MSKPRAKTEVEVHNRVWSSTKVRLLLDGECLINDGEDLISGRSAYEQRQRAYDGYASPDSILDAIQLDMAIDSIRDNEVRVAMKLRTLGAWDEYAIEEALNSRRAGHHLLNRGCDLVRRNERGNAGKVKRLKQDRLEKELAGLADPEPVKRKAGRPWNSNTPISQRGLKWLTRTQFNADRHIPGQETWEDHTIAFADMDKPINPMGGYQDLGDGGRKRSTFDAQD